MKRTGVNMNQTKTTAFRVFLNRKHIDTIFQTYNAAQTLKDVAEEVRRSLIEHDGYDSAIKVRR